MKNQEENLVKALKSLIDKPTGNVYPKKYSAGGQILSSLASLIPGYGAIVSPLISIADQTRDGYLAKQQAEKDAINSRPVQMNTNIYGQMMNGGYTTSKFKQYNTGGHTTGQDQLITENGVPSNNNVAAAVQNKENAYTNKNKTYIYSDTLVNPETGNTFNLDSAKTVKKYNKADKDPEQKNALDFTMNRLSKMNDVMRMSKESIQKALGGYTTLPDPTKPVKPIVNVAQESTAMTINNSNALYNAPRPAGVYNLNSNMTETFREGPNGAVTSIDVSKNRQIVQDPLAMPYQYTPETGGTSKSKSKERFREKADGGLTREDRGSDSKPYPSVKSSDFAGGNRSYPIPTKADAVDALRLAGLHGRSDVRAKVYAKYPDLKKALGGFPSSLLNNSLTDIKNYTDMSVPPSSNLSWYSEPSTNYGIQQLPQKTPAVASITPPPAVNVPSTVPIPQAKTKTTGVNTDFNLNSNAIALALKTVGLSKSIADALEKPVVEKPMLTDYTAADRQIYGTNVDYTQARQDALAASNLASNVNRAGSTGLNQYQTRMQSTYGNLADQLGQISMNENLQRNQQAMQRGQYETSKAVDLKNTMYQNRVDNLQNLANAKLADQKLFSEISQIGTEFNQYENYKQMVTNNKELAQARANEMMALIGSNYANFGFSDDFMERIKSGNATQNELIKFLTIVDSKTKK